MGDHRKLPLREQVFVMSLTLHGYRLVPRHHHLKKRKRYIIPASSYDDAGGVDFWIKLRGSTSLIPIQVTQRGTALFRRHHPASENQIAEFTEASRRRLGEKLRSCRRSGVAFVLIRDHDGKRTSRSLAWGDVKALNHGLMSFRGLTKAPAQ